MDLNLNSQPFDLRQLRLDLRTVGSCSDLENMFEVMNFLSPVLSCHTVLRSGLNINWLNSNYIRYFKYPNG